MASGRVQLVPRNMFNMSPKYFSCAFEAYSNFDVHSCKCALELIQAPIATIVNRKMVVVKMGVYKICFNNTENKFTFAFETLGVHSRARQARAFSYLRSNLCKVSSLNKYCMSHVDVKDFHLYVKKKNLR